MTEETSVLERAPLPRPEGTDLADIWGFLPDEVADQLGYCVLQEKQRRYRLWTALSDLGIQPFTADSVEDYKSRMVRKFSPDRPSRDRLLSIAEGVAVGVGLISLGPMLLGWIISWKISVAFFGVLIGCLSLLGRLDGTTVKGMPEWKTVPLEGYAEPVPEFALEMALRVRSRLPEATVGVCQLVRRERVLDPFLVVEHGEERHYIAVWSEPGFGARSEA